MTWSRCMQVAGRPRLRRRGVPVAGRTGGRTIAPARAPVTTRYVSCYGYASPTHRHPKEVLTPMILQPWAGTARAAQMASAVRTSARGHRAEDPGSLENRAGRPLIVHADD